MNDKKICSFPGMYEELVSFIEEFQLLRSDFSSRTQSDLPQKAKRYILLPAAADMDSEPSRSPLLSGYTAIPNKTPGYPSAYRSE